MHMHSIFYFTLFNKHEPKIKTEAFPFSTKGIRLTMIIIIIEGERGREWRRKWGEEEERKDDCGSQNKLLSYSHASNSLETRAINTTILSNSMNMHTRMRVHPLPLAQTRQFHN